MIGKTETRSDADLARTPDPANPAWDGLLANLAAERNVEAGVLLAGEPLAGRRGASGAEALLHT
jgi:hypothetical protein